MAGAKVLLGKEEIVPLITKDDVRITIPVSGRENIKTTVHYNSPLRAPILKGQQVATIKINVPDMESFEFPLYAGQAVEEVGFFKRALANAKLMIKNNL